jgi:hypothetical protein
MVNWRYLLKVRSTTSAVIGRQRPVAADGERHEISRKEDPVMLLIGMDQSHKEHEICIIDVTGCQLARLSVPHSAVGFRRLHECCQMLQVPIPMPTSLPRCPVPASSWRPRCCPSSGTVALAFPLPLWLKPSPAPVRSPSKVARSGTSSSAAPVTGSFATSPPSSRAVRSKRLPGLQPTWPRYDHVTTRLPKRIAVWLTVGSPSSGGCGWTASSTMSPSTFETGLPTATAASRWLQ